jgi:DNA-binding transcriptional MerR regulator
MLTISQIAKRFGLSRSALLYYDSIGLLSPSARSRVNYRLYSEADVERMELIDLYRQAGLSLADIARVLSSDGSGLTKALEARMQVLHREIQGLRRQQQLIVKLLRSHSTVPAPRSLDKEGWVAILRASGLDEDDMTRWHVEFERLSPDGHQEFLESLAIEPEEIDRIRERSREQQ